MDLLYIRNKIIMLRIIFKTGAFLIRQTCYIIF